MSDLPLKLRELASVLEDPYLNQAADLIEQQQKRIAELEHQVTCWMLEALTPPKGARR